jgi:predicted ester cyclase
MAVEASLRERREATVLEHMGAENEHDFERCIAAFSHPRYEIVPTGEVWDGASGVNTLLLENKRGFPDFSFHPEVLHHADDAVLVEGRFKGKQDGNWRGLPPTGRRVDFPLIIVFGFDGERMVCERTYFDIGTPLRQLGVARDPNTAAGRVATVLNHPIVVLRALLRGLLTRRSR